MQQENVDRVLEVLSSGDRYATQLASALLSEKEYPEIFREYVPNYLGQEYWPTISLLHEIVVASDPKYAHMWLRIAAEPLMTERSNYKYSFVQGLIIGFFKAGIWLDKHWEEDVEYHQMFLILLSRILSSPMKLVLNDDQIDKNGYTRQLTQTIKAYMFPTQFPPCTPRDTREQRTKNRIDEFRKLVIFLNDHGNDSNFSSIDKLVIERIFYGLIANRPWTQKIAAANFMFSQFGAPPLNDEEL